jgi:hypothetical protein
MAEKNQMKRHVKVKIYVESALERALENAQKDGSIVLSAGSMFVTAEVMKAWKKNESSQRVE